ncbi:MAG: hypothetical protein L0G70_00335 [Rubrobacter sp.]|nr:hypothetical protein [Rubrobacter sp.]
MRHDERSKAESNAEPVQVDHVQSFDLTSAIERLRNEKSYEDHGRSIRILTHEPSVKLALTVLAAGRSTGQRLVAGASTVQVLEGEMRFRVEQKRHVLSAGGTLVLQGSIAYDAEALTEAAFLYTSVEAPEHTQHFSRVAHPTQPEQERVGPDLSGAARPSE